LSGVPQIKRRRLRFARLNADHSCMKRPVLAFFDDRSHLVRRSHQQRLNAAVAAIADPTGKTVHSGDFCDKGTVANALHAPARDDAAKHVGHGVAPCVGPLIVHGSSGAITRACVIPGLAEGESPESLAVELLLLGIPGSQAIACAPE
jgi:hypothetical protein